MIKVVLKLAVLSIVEKIALGKKVIQMMTGNPNFTAPTPSLVDVQAQIDALDAAKTKADVAKETSKQMTSIQNQEEDKLDNILTKLSSYVEVTADGDAAKIESAGLTPSSKPQPIGELTAPQGLAVTSGDDAGELDVHWDKVRGAKSYIVQLNSVDPLKEDDWKEFTLPTKSSVALKGLASGTRYWVRVAAVGAAGRSGWSDPATKIAP